MISKPFLNFFLRFACISKCAVFTLAGVIPELFITIRELTLKFSVRDTGSELYHPEGENVCLNTTIRIHLIDALRWTIDLIRTLKHTVVLLTLIAVAKIAFHEIIRLKIRLILVYTPVGDTHQFESTDLFRKVYIRFLECLSRSHESHPKVDLFQIYHLILKFVL